MVAKKEYIMLDAYNHDDIRKLSVKYKVIPTPEAYTDSLVINKGWPLPEPYIITTIQINGISNLSISISKDTVMSLGFVMKRLYVQIEHNPAYLFPNTIRLNRLYADPLYFQEPGHKRVEVSFDGGSDNFFRIPMNDTLTIYNTRYLMHNAQKLRKSRKK